MSSVLALSGIAASVRQPFDQQLEFRARRVESLVEALRVTLRCDELLAQVGVLGAQALAQADELRNLGFERGEVGIHACTISFKFAAASRNKGGF